MSRLARRRCFNHAHREAVAQCTRCGNFFCRECVTEHDGRMTCARCLMPGTELKRKKRLFSGLMTALQLLAGIIIVWSAFYYLGKALLILPSHYHQATLWNSSRSAK